MIILLCVLVVVFLVLLASNEALSFLFLILLVLGGLVALYARAHETDKYRIMKDRATTIQMHPYPTAPR